MLSKVIGIISYLPNNKDIRGNRLKKLKNLVGKCNEIFALPIIIIAQNYKQEDFDYLKSYKNINFYVFDKLGIVGARNKLRDIFLNSNYDYLIMLDDDCKLEGYKSSGRQYLEQIDNNPNKFGEFNNTLLKLFAISKYMFNKIGFNSDIDPEKESGFEDRYFVNYLRKKYPNNRFIFNVPSLEEISISTGDADSTWYESQNLKNMLSKTENEILKI